MEFEDETDFVVEEEIVTLMSSADDLSPPLGTKDPVGGGNINPDGERARTGGVSE